MLTRVRCFLIIQCRGIESRAGTSDLEARNQRVRGLERITQRLFESRRMEKIAEVKTAFQRAKCIKLTKHNAPQRELKIILKFNGKTRIRVTKSVHSPAVRATQNSLRTNEISKQFIIIP